MKKRLLILLSLFTIHYSLFVSAASALDFGQGQWKGKLTGDGAVGGAWSDAIDQYIVSDFRIRAQGTYTMPSDWTFGAVYAIDQISTEHHYYARDAFVFTESKFGRAEIGWTDSIATKLGLGLPDVGGLRLNDYSIVYDIVNRDIPVISNPTIGQRYAFRATAVSIPQNPWQIGMSVAPWSNNFKSDTDIGVKYRAGEGKTKWALSFGGTFIDSPRDLRTDFQTPHLTADWRAEVSAGANIQYNSWVIGLNARGIYDEHAVGAPSDGIRLGAGASYDFLNYTASLSYIFSDIGIWRTSQTTAAPSMIAHTMVASIRYKLNKYFDIWASGGGVASGSDTSPFAAAGIHGKF